MNDDLKKYAKEFESLLNKLPSTASIVVNRITTKSSTITIYNRDKNNITKRITEFTTNAAIS